MSVAALPHDKLMCAIEPLDRRVAPMIRQTLKHIARRAEKVIRVRQGCGSILLFFNNTI